ncbi:MAG: phytanoyl-CoA dioxygenase family protein [Proteobacteria bacterium]|nr:phytanoyl-CoA dioxygenase family protein [Pseudomonadota bacterium]MCP4917121.1 phytanoyl-CoA dioxygenase family protein [Pseudomonadota bacterium]
MLLDGDRDLGPELAHFAEHGYARLGRVLSDEGAVALAERADDLMMGVQPDPGLFFQHDSETGRYEDLAFNAGWVGPSRRYRKVERLELDASFFAWIDNPLFGRIAHALLGPDVQLYRAVLWNKAPGRNMATPWHQDDGRFWGLDRPPSLQFWTALDDAPVEAGCLEVVPGSHRGGLATPEGGTITPESLAEADAEARAVPLPARRGEALLVHNHVWHRTGHNHTGHPRRAVSVSLLGGDVRCARKRRAPRQFRRLYEAE